MRSIEEIREIKNSLFDDYFSACHSNFQTVRDLYDQNINIKMPAGIEIYKPPSAREHINAAVNHIMIYAQDVYVPLWAETEIAKRLQSKMVKFGTAFLDLLDRHYKNVRRNCYKNAMLYGAYVLKMRYIPRLRENEPDMDDNQWERHLEQTFPFYFKGCYPGNTAWIDNDCIVEVDNRKVIQVQQNWSDWKTDKKPFADVKWWEYWDKHQRVFFADNDVVSEEPNLYGFLPYEIGYGGFGLESEGGNPEDLIVSMLAPNISSYRMEYRAKTAVVAGLEYGVYSRPKLTRDLLEGEQIPSAPGELVIVGKDAELEHFASESLNPTTSAILGIITSDQEKVTPGIMAGMGSKYETGYGQANRMDYARISLLTSLMSDWEGTAGTVLDKVVSLVKNEDVNVANEPIGILGNFTNEKAMITLKPEELNPSMHKFFVRLDAQTPEQKEHRIRLGMDELRTGGCSFQTYCEEYAHRDFITENERMAIERAMMHPAIQELIAQEAMKDAGMRDVLNMIQSGKLGKSKQLAPVHGMGGESNENMRDMTNVGSSLQPKEEAFR